MNRTQQRSPAPLRNALYELAVAKSPPDAELLDEFVRRYPEHATALTEFAIELALDAAMETADEPIELATSTRSSSVSKAMSRFHNHLYAVRKGAAPAIDSVRTVENPFVSLDKAKFRALGQHLNANMAFVIKLRDRQIHAATMSDGFRHRVAGELEVPIEVLDAHFAAPTQLQEGTRYKADQKPEAGDKQSFEQAVKSSGLTPEQQSYLLSL
jgi:hypothetical protein